MLWEILLLGVLPLYIYKKFIKSFQKLLKQTLAQHIVDGFEPSSPIAKSTSKVGKKQRRFNKQSGYKKKKRR